MKVLVFGNSGSGKSTYAHALAAREDLAHLDLDSIVWEPGKIAMQRSTESVTADLRSFIDSQGAWWSRAATANSFKPHVATYTKAAELLCNRPKSATGPGGRPAFAHLRGS